MASPILKWVGGKRQLLDTLRARFPDHWNRYHEPFVGGGAVFFDLEPDEAVLNDTNVRLMNFYDQVQNNPIKLIKQCKKFKEPDTSPDPNRDFHKEDHKGREVDCYFYQQRALFNRRPYGDGELSEDERREEAALLLYLNRTCYNGLYRENQSGGFNAPIGRYDDPDWVREEEIREASRMLEAVELRSDDFETVLEAVDDGDLVYCDPPYEPMSTTADFTQYAADDFDRSDQERLLEVVCELDQRGAHVVLSNSGVLYEMYDEAGFDVELVGARRAINSDASSRGEVDEIVATNVPTDLRRETD
jgi:DNA adenine methylase